jgi:hypothetical protein
METVTGVRGMIWRMPFSASGSSGRFTVDDLKAACRELPALQFVVLVHRDADNEAYERAEELGICLAGLGDLKSALRHDLNIGQHLNSEQAYLLSRLRKNRHVVSVRRCGRSAYEVLRKVPMPSLTIVATEDYEVTSDSVYELLEEYGGLNVHAIVSTSPACFGFAASPSLGIPAAPASPGSTASADEP